MNTLVNRLYGLTEAEKLLSEKGSNAHVHAERVSAPIPAPKISDLRPRRRRSSSSRRLEQTRSVAEGS